MARQRQYQAIWEKIRDSKKHICVVEVHPAFFARVKKAVIKEKSIDLGFKVLNDHDHFYLHIELLVDKQDKAKSKIRFTLKQSLGLEGVKS